MYIVTAYYPLPADERTNVALKTLAEKAGGIWRSTFAWHRADANPSMGRNEMTFEFFTAEQKQAFLDKVAVDFPHVSTVATE